MPLKKNTFFDRDLSWLSFNYRVLQEAKCPNVPLIERLKFLAIYSSNLDEFYRVRVAAHHHLLRLNKKSPKKNLRIHSLLIKQINRKVDKQQNELGHIFRNQLIPDLAKHNIFIIDDSNLSPQQTQLARSLFSNHVLPHIKPIPINNSSQTPFLHNKRLYFAAHLQSLNNPLSPSNEYYIVNIPTDKTSRFFVLPSQDYRHLVIQLDDIIRLSLDLIFPNKKIISFYSIKLSRDAELYLDDEFSFHVVDKIKKSLKKRDTGLPSRFLYDHDMPKTFLDFLSNIFNLKKQDLVPGGRYHNFSDFFSFPAPPLPHLFYEPLPPLPHPHLSHSNSLFSITSLHDIMFHFPYHSYDPIIHLIQEASTDPSVQAIKITLYRVANDSGIVQALINAAKNGINTTVFDEVKARFNEETNIFWGDELSKAGAHVIYSYDQLKVHSKLCLILRLENNSIKRYAFLSSGNFNEKTASSYCDHGLLTSDIRLTYETELVFNYLENPYSSPLFQHLLVAPFDLRHQLNLLIDNEIHFASLGKKASITIKVNSIEDHHLINKLYLASQAGVKIRLIVRGICCLIPGIPNLSNNIKATSIIDRFLEHARVYIFHNNGLKKIYVSSADWMKRNLDHRLEVAFPIYDPSIKLELENIINLQIKDNCKARLFNKTQSNPLVKSKSKKNVRAQYHTYYYLKKKIPPFTVTDTSSSTPGIAHPAVTPPSTDSS